MSSAFRYLLEKEFKQIARDRILLTMIFLFPTIMIGLTPWVINFNLRHLDLAVVSHDPGGNYSRLLLQKLEASPDIDIIGLYTSEEPAYQAVDRNKEEMILVIPPDFSRDMELSRHASVRVIANAINSTNAVMAMNRMSGLIADTSEEILTEKVGLSSGSGRPVEIRMLDRYNPTLNYKYYMLPAILVMVLTMLCGIYPAIGLANEKEVGTITQINLSPLRRSTYIVAKVLPYWLIGISTTLLGTLLIYLIYGLAPVGSYLLILLSALLFSGVIAFQGVAIANLAKSVQQAMFMELFSVMIFFIISGLFTPISTMPWWSKVIAYINPITYLNIIMRMVYLKGSPLTDLWPYLAALTAIGLVNALLAVLTHRKRQ